MEIAIIGLPQSGKSTLFKIMTGVNSSNMHGETVVKGIGKVPDERFSRLVEIFKPVKITPASIPFLDITAAGEKAWSTVRQHISGADGFIHIINAHSSANIQELAKNYQKLIDEMIFADLMMIENRLEKLFKLPAGSLKQEEKIQLQIFPKLKEALENNKPLRSLNLNDSETEILNNYSFLSIKPEIVVLNTAEEKTDLDESFRSESATISPVISICCQIEQEISELEPEERAEFLDSMGISAPAFERIIKGAFSLLNRIYYFTVGEDEVRAWVIKSGSTAPKAAAAIHKDFERGFIKAEVTGYNDFINSGASLSQAKANGKVRLEGKEYIVNDGDIISFRFNV